MNKTQRGLCAVCELVLEAKAAGRDEIVVNGVRFDDGFYDPDEGGRCQENVRKVYEAATHEDMPGKDATAYKTYKNLIRSHAEHVVCRDRWDFKKLKPGDILYFGGSGPGHVGIWLGLGPKGRHRMFQQTSRNGLGITQEGPTPGQKAKFLAAFRLLPD